MKVFPEILLPCLSLMIVYSVMCRVRHFDERTVWYVKAQHAAIAIGALLAVVVPMEWSAACVAAGIALFLLFGTPRWGHNPPEGITKRG